MLMAAWLMMSASAVNGQVAAPHDEVAAPCVPGETASPAADVALTCVASGVWLFTALAPSDFSLPGYPANGLVVGS
jgi:hypothetical protein